MLKKDYIINDIYLNELTFYKNNFVNVIVRAADNSYPSSGLKKILAPANFPVPIIASQTGSQPTETVSQTSIAFSKTPEYYQDVINYYDNINVDFGFDIFIEANNITLDGLNNTVTLDNANDKFYHYNSIEAIENIKMHVPGMAGYSPPHNEYYKNTFRVAFDDDRHYTVFRLTWADLPYTQYKIIDNKW